MADKTGISWTSATWNPVTGCAKVSQGCKHCYAERDWVRLVHLPAYKGRAFTDVACHPDRLDQPLRWERPRMIFVNSMSDLFHEDVPFEFIDQVFAVMALAKNHVFQVLTKRPSRMLSYLSTNNRQASVEKARVKMLRDRPDGYYINPEKAGGGNVWTRWPLPNVWLGVSVEDQAAANERIPLLLKTPAAIRWISAEPLLGPIDLRHVDFGPELSVDVLSGVEYMSGVAASVPAIDWLVVGGESGTKARPMRLDWARSLRDQCAAAKVPFFFKQTGAWQEVEDTDFIPPKELRYFPELDQTLRYTRRGGSDLLDDREYKSWPKRMKSDSFGTG